MLVIPGKIPGYIQCTYPTKNTLGVYVANVTSVTCSSHLVDVLGLYLCGTLKKNNEASQVREVVSIASKKRGESDPLIGFVHPYFLVSVFVVLSYPVR